MRKQRCGADSQRGKFFVEFFWYVLEYSVLSPMVKPAFSYDQRLMTSMYFKNAVIEPRIDMQYSEAKQTQSTLSALKVEQLMSINSMSKLDRKQNVLGELAASTNVCTSQRVSVFHNVLGIHFPPASNTFAAPCFRLKVQPSHIDFRQLQSLHAETYKRQKSDCRRSCDIHRCCSQSPVSALEVESFRCQICQSSSQAQSSRRFIFAIPWL